MSHTLETVQGLYQAFGRGDVPAILAQLSPDVRWESWAAHSAQQAGHPLYAARVGPQQASEFFAVLGQNMEIHEFKVLDVFGSGRQVAGECLIDYTWRPTGKRLQDEELHLWTFGDDGKVVRFRHYVDTAKHMRAAGLLADQKG
ncbi:MAG: nuclear transport factor 2 family protein [Variovorax sp.]